MVTDVDLAGALTLISATISIFSVMPLCMGKTDIVHNAL